MCQKYEENELGNLKILYEVPYKKKKKTQMDYCLYFQRYCGIPRSDFCV